MTDVILMSPVTLVTSVKLTKSVPLATTCVDAPPMLLMARGTTLEDVSMLRHVQPWNIVRWMRIKHSVKLTAAPVICAMPQ
jgi:hypothetical protein